MNSKKNVAGEGNEEEWPEECPECGSKNLSHENVSEYTGGGFSDYWTEFTCEDCGHYWQWGKKSGFT